MEVAVNGDEIRRTSALHRFDRGVESVGEFGKHGSKQVCVTSDPGPTVRHGVAGRLGMGEGIEEFEERSGAGKVGGTKVEGPSQRSARHGLHRHEAELLGPPEALGDGHVTDHGTVNRLERCHLLRANDLEKSARIRRRGLDDGPSIRSGSTAFRLANIGVPGPSPLR